MNVSPIDGTELCLVTGNLAEDIDAAVADARRCWTDQTWRRFNARAKKRVLRGIADLVGQHRDELALLETLDTGRPISDSLSINIPLVADCFEWYAEVIDKQYDEALSTTSDNLITISREPLGVVGAIVPWNFPLLMAAWKLASALVIGNSMVSKPDEKPPLTAIRLAQLALEADLPPGAFNVCPGGKVAGEALGRHLDVDCITFTGSVAAGNSKITGVPTGELIERYYHRRLLARVFHTDPEGWVLKGGQALLARWPKARYSTDVDLLRLGEELSVDSAVKALIAAASGRTR